MEEIYKALALRNGWTYVIQDERPYFMKNGNYATPDETTSDEDKELLATIMSEGSDEMKNLIIICWNNGIKISGPCSGIKEFHNKQPFALHFSMIGSKDLINQLYSRIEELFPDFSLRKSEKNNELRFDINYFLNGKELMKTESDLIFREIRKVLEDILITQKQSTSHK
jgi:hypothetical protein